MVDQSVVVQGTLYADGKLDLRGPVPLPPGPVEVTVRAIPLAEDEDILILLARIRAEQQVSGCSSRSGEEIDSDVQQMRDDWPQHPVEAKDLQAISHCNPNADATESAP